MQVEARNVLVTGASAGIGAALALELAGRGARLGLVGRRPDRLDAVADACRREGADVYVWAVDLGDVAAAEALAIEAWDAMGGLDVIVHNAAIPRRRSVTALTPAELDETMRVNFQSPACMTLALLPRMLARDSGVIVNVSSFGGRAGIVAESAYCASKFALCGWSESLALDLWSTGVEVRLIIPGAIDTEIWDRPDNDPAHYDGPLEPPETVARGIADAIQGDGFEHRIPDLSDVIDFKNAAIDDYLAGTAAFAADAAAKTREARG